MNQDPIKKDPPDWAADDWFDHILIWCMGALGWVIAFLLVFWLLAIFEVLR